LGKTEAFWRPFLSNVMLVRLDWLRAKGFRDLADAMERTYQTFPPNMSVKDCVLSKFYFEEFPPGFPFAREVSEERQALWAMSRTRYRASSFVESDRGAPPHHRVGEYKEISPMWVHRGVFLQRYCHYTVAGLRCGTFNGREYFFVNPALVQIRGWKSSFTSSWYRLGVWRLERFMGGRLQRDEADETDGLDRASFVFEGKFSATVQRPRCQESTGLGKLWINGMEMGQFRVFNLFGLADWQVHTLGFECKEKQTNREDFFFSLLSYCCRKKRC
jgi:hypothetical protein